MVSTFGINRIPIVARVDSKKNMISFFMILLY